MFLKLFSRCPGAILSAFCCGLSFAADSHCCNSSGFDCFFRHHGNPLYFNFSKAASLQYAVPTTSFWKYFSLQCAHPFPELLLMLQTKSVALTGQSLPTHPACCWVHPLSRPAGTSSCNTWAGGSHLRI